MPFFGSSLRPSISQLPCDLHVTIFSSAQSWLKFTCAFLCFQQGIYCSTTHIQEHKRSIQHLIKPFLVLFFCQGCVKGNWSNLSTQSCKSWRPFSFWQIDVDDGEVSSKSLNLLSWSLNSKMSGCVLVGKLLERVCWWDLGWQERLPLFSLNKRFCSCMYNLV